MANGINIPQRLLVVADDMRRHNTTLTSMVPERENPSPKERRVYQAHALIEEAARLLIEAADAPSRNTVRTAGGQR